MAEKIDDRRGWGPPGSVTLGRARRPIPLTSRRYLAQGLQAGFAQLLHLFGWLHLLHLFGWLHLLHLFGWLQLPHELQADNVSANTATAKIERRRRIDASWLWYPPERTDAASIPP